MAIVIRKIPFFKLRMKKITVAAMANKDFFAHVLKTEATNIITG